MFSIKKTIFYWKYVDLPYELKDIWLSYAIPSKEKFMGRVLKLKEYPNFGDIVFLFSYRGKKAFYKTVKAKMRDHLTSDLACWDNGKEYSFEFSHLES